MYKLMIDNFTHSQYAIYNDAINAMYNIVAQKMGWIREFDQWNENPYFVNHGNELEYNDRIVYKRGEDKCNVNGRYIRREESKQ